MSISSNLLLSQPAEFRVVSTAVSESSNKVPEPSSGAPVPSSQTTDSSSGASVSLSAAPESSSPASGSSSETVALICSIFNYSCTYLFMHLLVHSTIPVLTYPYTYLSMLLFFHALIYTCTPASPIAIEIYTWGRFLKRKSQNLAPLVCL